MDQAAGGRTGDGRRGFVRAAVWPPAAGCALWAVLRLSGVEPFWPVSALLAVTPWVVLASLATVLLAVLARHRPAATVAALSLLTLMFVLAPRAWSAADDRGGPTLRVMTVNLRVGAADAATIVRLVRDDRVDLVAMQEYTPAAKTRL
ncbi:MAG: endonuclease/exonuclease/phosphatase family protein, partial [Actinocatenispora sp.]